MRLQTLIGGVFPCGIGGFLRRYGPWIPLLTLLLLSVACNSPSPHVTMDAPELAASLRYLARSAIVCVVLAGGVVVWTTLHRRNLPQKSSSKERSTHGDHP